MFKHIIKITLRNYRKNLLFTIIIVSGLAISMATIMVISRYMIQEYSTDQFHKEFKNLYQAVNINSEETSTILTADKAGQIKSNNPEVIQTCRIDKITLTVNPLASPLNLDNVLAVDPSFFSLFSFPVISGNISEPLPGDKSIVITVSLAKKLFGKQDPVGQVIVTKISSKEIPLTVTAVVNDPPEDSRIQFEALVSFASEEFHFRMMSFSTKEKGIYNRIFMCNTYFLLHDKADLPLLNSRIKKDTYRENREDGYFSYTRLQPLSEVYFDASLGDSFFKRGNKSLLYIFLSLALLLILLAAINYINLSTIKVFSRMKEVAYKKISGATRKVLIFQFLFESAGLSVVAFILAIFLSKYMAVFFSSLVNASVDVTYFYHFPRILWILLFAVVLGCISGFYPSFIMTRFKSSDLMKGYTGADRFGLILPKNLFIFQFTIAIALIIAAFIIGNQLRFINKKDPGFEKAGLLHISVPSDIRPFALRDELLKDPGIEAVCLSYGIPGKKVMTDGKIWFVSSDSTFLSTFKIRLLKGRNFRSSDKQVCLVNETLVKANKWDDYRGKSMGDKEVIGVIGDFNTSSLRAKIVPVELDFGTSYLPDMTIRLKKVNSPNTMENIRATWKKMVPCSPMEYFFYDEWFDNMYRNEEAFSSLISAFTFIAILISCLGLFGLLSYSIGRREREIGIRKVNGANTMQILLMINSDFIKWVVISFMIAVPLSVFLLNKWLEHFAYQASLSWWIFVLSGLMAIIIAVITVSWKSWIAARRNPAESLKYE